MREVLIEITYVGNVARVAALDPESGVEVVVQAPANAARADLEALAVRKLERALSDRSGGPPQDRPGKLV